MKSGQKTLQINNQEAVLGLYDRYAAMLLGYVFEIVKDKELAEQYMVSIFKAIADQYNEIYRTENTWLVLQQLAKRKLAGFLNSIKDCDAATASPNLNTTQNKLLNLMDTDQKHVFCSVYYQGKTIAQLAVQLNKTELVIRKTLKEAFAIIRNSREYPGVH